MNLQLFINNKLIGSIPLDKSSISDPLYLPLKKIELENRHTDAIDGYAGPLTYYIEAGSSMNERRKSMRQKAKNWIQIQL